MHCRYSSKKHGGDRIFRGQLIMRMPAKIFFILIALACVVGCQAYLQPAGPRANTPESICGKPTTTPPKNTAYIPEPAAQNSQAVGRELMKGCIEAQGNCISTYCQSFLSLTRIFSGEKYSDCTLRCRVQNPCAVGVSEFQVPGREGGPDTCGSCPEIYIADD